MRLRRVAAASAAALLGAILAYAVAATLGGLWLSRGATTQAEGVEIALVRGPIHYDFLLPATAETRLALGFAAPAGVPVWGPEVEWLLVGRGGRLSYTTTGTYRDLSAAAIWRGAVGDDAVLRLDAFGPLPTAFDPPRLTLSAASYAALLDGIANSVAGPEPLDGPGFSATDAFFAARGRADLLYTCNAWIGARLRAAGVAFGRWTPTAAAVELSLWRLGAATDDPPR